MPFLLLPLFEIIGFVTIGGRIGLGATLLWLMAATALGFWLLRRTELGNIGRFQNDSPEMFGVESVFGDLCLIIAALLLIFPGFISDFFAVPFLMAPLRHWMFRRVKDNPDSVFRQFVKRGQNFSYGYYRAQEKTPQSTTTIEGEFKRIDDKNNFGD